MLRATTEHAEHAQKASRESTEFPHLFNSKRSGHEGKESTRKAPFVPQRAAAPQHSQEGLPQRRQGKRGSFRPRQTDRASCEAFTLVGAFPRFVKAHEPPSRDYARLGLASEPLAHFSPKRATRTQPGVSVALPPVKGR